MAKTVEDAQDSWERLIENVLPAIWESIIAIVTFPYTFFVALFN